LGEVLKKERKREDGVVCGYSIGEGEEDL